MQVPLGPTSLAPSSPPPSPTPVPSALSASPTSYPHHTFLFFSSVLYYVSSVNYCISADHWLATLLTALQPAPDYVRELIRKTRSLTSRPFGAAIVLPFPYEENLRVVLEEKLAVLQVYWGEFPREWVQEAHRAGVKVLHQVRQFFMQ